MARKSKKKKSSLPAYMQGVKRSAREGKRLRLEKLRGIAATGIMTSQTSPVTSETPAPGNYDDIAFKLDDSGKFTSKDESTFVGRMLHQKSIDCPVAPGDYTLPEPSKLPLFSKLTDRDTPLWVETLLKESAWKRGVGDYDIAAHDSMKKGIRISNDQMNAGDSDDDISSRKTFLYRLLEYEKSNGTGPATFNLQDSQNYKAPTGSGGDGRFIAHATGGFLDRTVALAADNPGPADYNQMKPEKSTISAFIRGQDELNWLGHIVNRSKWKLGPGHNNVSDCSNDHGIKISKSERKTLPLDDNVHVPGPGAYVDPIDASSIDGTKGPKINPADGTTFEDHLLRERAAEPGPTDYDPYAKTEEVKGGQFRVHVAPNWVEEKMVKAASIPGVGQYTLTCDKIDRGAVFLKEEGGSFVDNFSAKADEPGPFDTAEGTVGVPTINRGPTGVFVSKSTTSFTDKVTRGAEERPGPGEYHPEREVTTFKPRLLGDRTVELIRSTSALKIYDRGEIIGKAGNLSHAAKMGGQQKHSQANHMTNLLRANTAHGKITDKDYTLQYRHRMHQWKDRGDSTTGPEKMFNFGASSLPKPVGATGRLRPEGVRSTPAITVGGVVKRATRLDTLAETAMQMQGDKAANRFKSNHNPLIRPPRQDIGAPWQSADTYRDTQTGKFFILDEGEYIEARHSVQSLRKGHTFSNNRGFRKVDEDAARVRSVVSELLASDGITARQT